ncbi:hypothetical protein HC248_00438 [Polaromonas vacuolata]|uniref:Uncharacterized protein n=2 Tax=Polaromonas vacuolata TaxID=37448 RepID=A0A6H2H5P6_9BURK|nr:hypothetical protein HC248_00438 [Polaromonas vacuolata]
MHNMNKNTLAFTFLNPQRASIGLRPTILAMLLSLASLSVAAQAGNAQTADGVQTPEKPAVETGGLKIEANLNAVYQGINGTASSDAQAQRRLNYRGDVFLTLPAGEFGSASGTALAQFRVGVGSGVTLRPTYSATPNSTGFTQDTGANSYYATLAQAYYQLVFPLGAGDKAAQSRLEVTAGKLDLFAFFDQNAVSGDEGRAFLNNAFVHNPLLDSGADIGADKYGFAPAARLALLGQAGRFDYGFSLGVFASGPAADFSASPSQPLVIGQFELSPQAEGAADAGARAHYRVYAWTNGQTRDFDQTRARHSGWGVSLDQKVGQDWNLSSRYGQRTSGSGRFDKALTLAVEYAGSNWGRSTDALGLAAGLLKTGSRYQVASQDGSLQGYASGGNERLMEIYYRYQVNEKLSLSPDFQLISRPGGDGNASRVRVAGLRANLGF